MLIARELCKHHPGNAAGRPERALTPVPAGVPPQDRQGTENRLVQASDHQFELTVGVEIARDECIGIPEGAGQVADGELLGGRRNLATSMNSATATRAVRANMTLILSHDTPHRRTEDQGLQTFVRIGAQDRANGPRLSSTRSL